MNKIPPEKIFKSYDIRGIYPEDINEENVTPIAKAIYTLLLKDKGEENRLKIVVGRDMRLSSPAIFETISKTLSDLGAEVIDIGIVSTPTVYFAVHYYKYDAGIQISASHNPGHYNGIKIVKNTPNGLLKIGKPTGMDDIKKMSIEGVEVSSREGGSVRQQSGVLEDEIQNAIAIVKPENLKPFKIVADAANAMGATYLEELFKHIPGDVVRMNFELDGSFPAHQADPMQPENLVDIQKRLIEEKADIGFAPDGDGDRFFILDENAEIVPPSIITGIVARELLRDHPGQKIVTDLKYQFNSRSLVEKMGGELVISVTGHAYVTQKMTEVGAIFAGEASAHYYFRETGNAESALPIILSVLEVMSREGKKLSEIASELKVAHESGEINFEVENAKELMEKLKNKYSDGEVSEIDGVSIIYPDWHVSLRTSNTEPLLRLNIEAWDKEIMDEKKEEIIKLINPA